ncbi:MAG: class I SAM-dependent methyltransferase [Thiohalomonadales bacterium]
MNEILNRDQHRGPKLLTKDGVDIIDCTCCGFRHISPLPSTAKLQQFYRETFYTEEKVDYLKSAEEDQDWLSSIYNDRFDSFEVLLPSHKRNILDVGCGPGFFLLTGMQRGFNVTGLEPAPQAAEFARNHGVNVIEGFFSTETIGDIPPQDVIHMSQVLEHLARPAEALTLAHKLLNPGGLICISVPNDFNPLQYALVQAEAYSPWWVVPKHHLNYFDYDSLESLLQRHGFKPLEREASFPLELFLLMGENYVEDAEIGKAIHNKRKRLELTLAEAGFNDVKRSLFKALAQAGLGRLAIVIARKN